MRKISYTYMSGWEELAARSWTRKRWRATGDSEDRCVRCEASFNRPDAYYVRPAYTDGEVWMCAACYDRMTIGTGNEIDHRYGQRRGRTK